MLRRKYITEARVQRDIDSGIWASMSSMSSRMRKAGSDGSEVKAKRNDSADVLLQKYVAGLLTMKSECPETESDIARIGVYQQLGQAYINAGGKIQDIQRKYINNGGTINFEISNEQDFPPYEEVDIDDNPSREEYNNRYEEIHSEPAEDNSNRISAARMRQDYDETPAAATARPVINDNGKVLNFDNALEPLDDMQSEEPIETEDAIEKYFRTVFRVINKAKPGEYIIWNINRGIELSEEDYNAIAVCVASGNNFIDNKPRFMFRSQSQAALENPGNNGTYDDFYFKAKLNGNDHFNVIPGNKYHYREGINGKEYTDILVKCNNGAAKEVRNMVNRILNRMDPGTGALSNISDYISKNAYLPTLMELSYAFDELEPGRYWTSSVADQGNSNIIYEIGIDEDKFLKGDSPNDTANVVAFITF